jgi:sulfatase maturation enzyme AslB (radical SAM superfamily)
MKCLAIEQAISISTGGQLRPCCMMRHEEFPFDGEKSIKVYRNSQWLENLRESMAQGIEPKECHQCFDSERLGLSSYRNYINSKLTESNSQAIEYLDLHLGNTCNSECAMCWEEDSSRIEQRILTSRDLKIFPRDLVNYDVIPTRQKLKWYNQPGFFDWFKDQVPNLKLLKLLGGEPFLIDNTEIWLDWVIESGHAKHITLHFNTNASSLNEQLLFRYIKHFKYVMVHASVDGRGDIYNWIRHGLDWNIVEKNVLEFSKYVKAFTNKFHMTAECVVQIYNLRYLLDLLEWSESNELSLNWIFLTHPSYLNVLNLQDKSFINQVIDDLEKFKSRSNQQNAIVKLTDYLRRCLVVTDFPQDKFIRYTNYMNSFRKLQFDSNSLKLAS